MYIFVHIPKTAGTTFKNLLYNTGYKREELLVIDSQGWLEQNSDRDIFSNRTQLPGSKKIQLNPQVKFLSGHVKASGMEKLFPGQQLITWIRDPIQRLLSSYNYYLRIGKYYGEFSASSRGYDLIDIETWCTHVYKTDNMSKQLDLPLDNFKFIGITEHFEAEVERFKNITGVDLLNGKKYNEVCTEYNINPTKKSIKERYEVNNELKQLIIEHNKEDYDLYNKCLQLAGYKNG
jgi:hypothetical protein